MNFGKQSMRAMGSKSTIIEPDRGNLSIMSLACKVKVRKP